MSGRTLCTVLEETAAQHGGRPALHQPAPGAAGNYQVYSWRDYREAVREIACGLSRLGVVRGDVVALHAETRAEFYLADLGVMALGAISAALYTSYPAAELVRNIEASTAKVVFVDTPRSLWALREAGGDRLRVEWILMTGEAAGVRTLAAVRAIGRGALAGDRRLFDALHAPVSPEDPAILYQTSGATGAPKMALTTHGALAFNIDIGLQVADLSPADSVLAFLPAAHIAQRIGVELLSVRTGVSTWFSEGLSRLPHELAGVRPTFFLAPPRVWERIYSSICTEIRKRGPLTRRLFHAALGLGLLAGRYRERGQPLPGWLEPSLRTADRLVFQTLRRRFGGRMRLPASGAAPLSKDLARFYDAIGMPLIEGYGLTEGGITTLNPLTAPRFGSIGKPLPGIEVKLGEDGELLLRGPTLFAGYFQDPAATAEVLRDGWLATGDLAEIDADGYIHITGRKKELIVASNGKKIYPARIEGLFKTEPLISQMILLGDRKPYVSALFTVNIAAARTLKGMDQLEGRPPAEIAAAPAVAAEIKRAVARVNRRLAPFEQIRKFRILTRDFAIDQGELTATMKVRRARVLENFQSAVSELYATRDDGD